MADERVRELERRFQESRAPDDEAAWLRERVRTGQLDPRHLDLAAFMGHAPAALAGGQPDAEEDRREGVLGFFQRAASGREGQFVSWARHVTSTLPGAFGKECAVRAALAAARLVEAPWSDQHDDDSRLTQAVELAQRWLEAPSAGVAAEAGQTLPPDDPVNRINRIRALGWRYREAVIEPCCSMLALFGA